jgi:oligoribonuclease NrnB/cAMP/cGMP phosphodiesterase (DHH superfamily)
MKCFYHNDLDGRCAGSIVAKYENNYIKENFFEVDYVMNLPLDLVQENERVYFVDYSFKKDTIWQLEKVLEKTKDVIWIDHHTSSLNLENELPWTKEIKGIRRDKISGAKLTYMYCANVDENNVPYTIDLVSDYDCWIYNLEPDTTFFKIGIETKNYDALDSIWLDLYDVLNPKTFDLINIGKTIKGYIDNDNTYYREHFAYESEIEGHKCLVVNRKTNSWVFGERYNDYPLVMVWVYNGEKYTYSIFSSNKDIDCSKIAEKFGGEGHKGAAGFSSTELLFKKVSTKC